GGNSPEYEKTNTNYSCLLYEHDKLERVKDLATRRDSYLPPDKRTPMAAGILNGKALRLPKPPYPPEAKRHQFQGRVIVQITFDEAGRVIDAKDLCQGPPYLSNVSVHAARLAQFAPVELNGQPVKVTGVILYDFVWR